MKKSIIYGLFAFALVAGTTTSCSKYEEGPKLTLLTKKARLVGSWKLTAVETNGVAETINYTADMEIKKDGTYTQTYSYVVFGQTYSSSDKGTWEFNDDKTKLKITAEGETTPTETEIYRLANKELKFKDVDGSTTTITTFEAK